MIALQYDMFEVYDPQKEVLHRLDEQDDCIRRTQKRLFAQQHEMMKLIIQQAKVIEELENRLNRLIK